jgi:hypothetical protein
MPTERDSSDEEHSSLCPCSPVRLTTTVPLLRLLARQRDGILFPDAQSLDHCTIPRIADATKVVEQPPTAADQEQQATP